MKTFEKNLNSVRILLALRFQRKTTGHVNPDKFSKVIVIYVCMHVCVCVCVKDKDWVWLFTPVNLTLGRMSWGLASSRLGCVCYRVKFCLNRTKQNHKNIAKDNTGQLSNMNQRAHVF